MVPLNLSASSSASGKLDSSGTYNQASGSGDWNVNFGNPSLTDHAAPTVAVSASMSPLLIVAALGAAWLLLKK